MSITAKELARLLNLSESAVSLALNNRPGVSTFTRKRVLAAAKEQGYDFSRKNFIGGGKQGIICFAVYKRSGAVVDDTPFFAGLTDGVNSGCRRENYDCVTRYLYEDEDLEEQINVLNISSFSGIIILATEMMEGTLKLFASLTVPYVFMDAYYEKPEYNYIMINNVQGAYIATSYLIRKRRIQPGYLRSAYSISNFEQRADGFYKAIRAAGLSASTSPVLRLTPSQEGAYQDMKHLLESGEKPADSYFADNDLIAIGAIQAMKEAGYRIPEDVAVIGFDDMPACEYMTPPLSTVMVPKVLMGEIAARRIIELAAGKLMHPLKIEVNTQLIKRKSV